MPLDESIDFGIFDAHPDEDRNAKVLSLAKTRVTSGAGEVVITVDEAPAVVAIDPYIYRIDRDRFDNFRAVEPAEASSP